MIYYLSQMKGVYVPIWSGWIYGSTTWNSDQFNGWEFFLREFKGWELEIVINISVYKMLEFLC